MAYSLSPSTKTLSQRTPSGRQVATIYVGERFHPGGSLEVQVLEIFCGWVKLAVRNTRPSPDDIWQGISCNGPGYFMAGKATGPVLVLHRSAGSQVCLNDSVLISILEVGRGSVRLAAESLKRFSGAVSWQT